MADIAKRLTPEDVSAVAAWLASRPVPVPVPAKASESLPEPLPQECGSVPR
jgi:cytochrome c553